MVLADWLKSPAASMFVPTSVMVFSAVRLMDPEPERMLDTRAVLVPSLLLLVTFLPCTPTEATALLLAEDAAPALAPRPALALEVAAAAALALPSTYRPALVLVMSVVLVWVSWAARKAMSLACMSTPFSPLRSDPCTVRASALLIFRVPPLLRVVPLLTMSTVRVAVVWVRMASTDVLETALALAVAPALALAAPIWALAVAPAPALASAALVVLA